MTASDLDALVRRVDQDRWLASRFAPPLVRRRLVALYALNYEIARTADVVSDRGIGLIRLAWWREALAKASEGGSQQAHPVLRALQGAQLRLPVLNALIDARERDFEAAPFQSWSDLEFYLDATAGGLITHAIEACGCAEPSEDIIRYAGRAWGYLGLARAEPFWRARGRSFLPQASGSLDDVIDRALGAYARASSRALSSNAFPALGYLALVPSYARALKRGRRETPLLERQLKLIAAAAKGRL
ncbi:MAG: squalene/phytoene synthase family protein [Terricaulis sp.]